MIYIYIYTYVCIYKPTRACDHTHAIIYTCVDTSQVNAHAGAERERRQRKHLFLSPLH